MAYVIPLNVTQPSDFYIGVSSQISALTPLLLFMIFAITTISGYSLQEKRNGRANMFMWLAIGSFLTNIVTLILFLVDDVINIEIASIVTALTIVFIALFLFQKDTNY